MKTRYLLGVGAVPVDAVSLRRNQPGANADDEARNPNQIHVCGEEEGKEGGRGSSGGERWKRATQVRRPQSHALSRRRSPQPPQKTENVKKKVFPFREEPLETATFFASHVKRREKLVGSRRIAGRRRKENFKKCTYAYMYHAQTARRRPAHP